MECFNPFGLIFMILIMIPNIISAIKSKVAFESKFDSRFLEIIEQIGRYGCFIFMIFNIPGTCLGWRSDEVFSVYIIADIILVSAYCIMWIVLWKKNNILKALSLSIIPSLLFLFSGVISRSLLLIISSLLFAPAHIIISYKNAG